MLCWLIQKRDKVIVVKCTVMIKATWIFLLVMRVGLSLKVCKPLKLESARVVVIMMVIREDVIRKLTNALMF